MVEEYEGRLVMEDERVILNAIDDREDQGFRGYEWEQCFLSLESCEDDVWGGECRQILQGSVQRTYTSKELSEVSGLR